MAELNTKKVVESWETVVNALQDLQDQKVKQTAQSTIEQVTAQINALRELTEQELDKAKTEIKSMSEEMRLAKKEAQTLIDSGKKEAKTLIDLGKQGAQSLIDIGKQEIVKTGENKKKEIEDKHKEVANRMSALENALGEQAKRIGKLEDAFKSMDVTMGKFVAGMDAACHVFLPEEAKK